MIIFDYNDKIDVHFTKYQSVVIGWMESYMVKQRHLNNAPIVEAVIDIRVKNPPSLKISDFDCFKKLMANKYPEVKDSRQIKFDGKFEDGKIKQSFEDQGVTGFFFKSPDGKNIAQLKTDGITFSRMQPYSSWEEVLAEAKSLWRLYSSQVCPELITRIAVRYINKISLKLPIDDLKKYFTAPPQIPKTLPQDISQFLLRVMIGEGDITANIIQATESSKDPNNIVIILDIDVFKMKDLPTPYGGIWDEFEQLHAFKNRVFFESLTEETVRLFE
jgi:uncharacterized protein (TIGR04255 family)